MIKKVVFALALAYVTVLALPAVAGEHPAAQPEHPAKVSASEHPATGGEHPSEHPAAAPKKEVTTADISTGIRKYIADQTKANGGTFQVMDGDKKLMLTLIKVHEDKLANLGAGSYFACTDFTGTDGNKYDVDFFLTGDAGAMTVTETAIHKLNGTPRYTWKQEADGKWTKVTPQM